MNDSINHKKNSLQSSASLGVADLKVSLLVAHLTGQMYPGVGGRTELQNESYMFEKKKRKCLI